VGKKRLYHPFPPFPTRSDQGTAETQGDDSVDSITAVQSVLRCHAGGLLPASQIGVLLARINDGDPLRQQQRRHGGGNCPPPQ